MSEPRIISLSGAPYPKARIDRVDAAAGVAVFTWLTAQNVPIDSGQSIARFTPGSPSGNPPVYPEPSDATLASAIASPPALPAAVGVWPPLEFLERFTSAELVALFTSNNNNVILFRVKALAARQIRTDNPQLDNGLTVLVNQGIITSGRKAELLTA